LFAYITQFEFDEINLINSTVLGDELKEVTDNFGQDSLVGEGSYGRLYYGVLKSRQATPIKKLDASKQLNEEFCSNESPPLCVSFRPHQKLDDHLSVLTKSRTYNNLIPLIYISLKL
jgi:hypothetical protein